MFSQLTWYFIIELVKITNLLVILITILVIFAVG